MKVWINVTVGDPPIEWLFDLLNWFSKELLKLTSARPDVVAYRDVGEIDVVVNRISGVRDCGGQSHFPLVASYVFFMYKTFCIVDPLLFPALLLEVLEF